jgi:hypothetical protein
MNKQAEARARLRKGPTNICMGFVKKAPVAVFERGATKAPIGPPMYQRYLLLVLALLLGTTHLARNYVDLFDYRPVDHTRSPLISIRANTSTDGTSKEILNSNFPATSNFIEIEEPKAEPAPPLPEVKLPFQYSYIDDENVSIQDIDASVRSTKLCDSHPNLCAKGRSIKQHIRSRQRYTSTIQTSQPRIYIDTKVFNFFGRPRWLSNDALKECSRTCSIVQDSNSDVIIHLFTASDYGSGKAIAVLNLEPHGFEQLPTGASNLVLMSFHAESEVIVNYGYSLMHSFGLCVGDWTGSRDDGKPCENMRAQTSAFYKWCDQNYGDLFTCLFQIVPHITQVRFENKLSDALAVAWITQTCERHDNYLKRLMHVIKVDSMGGCHRNRDETTHPGLQQLEDHDSIWWGKGNPVPVAGSWARKMLIMPHYKFYISLENTIIEDYVTEKFYEGFLGDALMVYLGAPNAQRYAPASHSFINALDFDGPEALGAFLLALADDPDRYRSYFAWREARPVRVSRGFIKSMSQDMVRLDGGSMLCRLCRAV